MIGNHLRIDTVAFEQLPGHAGILAGDHIGPVENIGGAGRQITHIPDRRRDNVQPRFQPARITDTFTWPGTVARLRAVVHIVRNRMHR